MSPSPGEFKEAMARLSAHVSIVTAYDRAGVPRGFTASSVCSLSLDPPLVLVCIARTTPSHDVVVHAERFAVHVLREHHEDLATRFATAGADRFRGAGFHHDPHAPHLPDALTSLTCSVHATHPGGDHTIVVGRVERVATSGGEPLVYYDRRFCRLALAHAV